jgi:hypothetical protein
LTGGDVEQLQLQTHRSRDSLIVTFSTTREVSPKLYQKV